MLAYIYEWLQNLSVYMILMTAVLQILPDNSYKKYIRFFTGLLLVMLLMTPVLKLFGMESSFRDMLSNAQYEQEKEMLQEAGKYLEQYGNLE